MKTIEIKIYSFDELTETAQQNAINHFRYHLDNSFEYDNIISSVKKLIDIFDLKTGNEYTDLRYSHIEDNILELSGVRLYKYILNNYGSFLFQPKYLKCIDNAVNYKQFICKQHKDHKGEIYTQLYSKYKKTDSCVLTGVCYDDDILKPVYKFLKNPCKLTTFEDLIQDIENAISKTFQDVEDWLNSDEYIIDTIEANDYDFNENGKLY